MTVIGMKEISLGKKKIPSGIKFENTLEMDSADFDLDACQENHETDVVLDIFHSIRGTENSRLSNQKQAFTILKATEDSLKEQSLPMTPASYYEALFPLLDDEGRESQLSRFSGDENRVIEFNVAVCYLLAFVFPHLPEDFIQIQYQESGRLYATLSHAMRRFHLIAPFVRSMTILVGGVLKAHCSHDWREDHSSLGELMIGLLGWASDGRPKVRKAAQEAIGGLLRKSECRPLAAPFVMEFLASALLNTCRKDPNQVTLHLLPLLKQALPQAVSKDLESSDDSNMLNNVVTGLLNVLNLGNSQLTCAGYDLLLSYALDQIAGLSRLAPEQQSSLGNYYGIIRRIQESLLKHRPAANLPELSLSFLPAFSHLTLLTINLQIATSKEAAPAITLRTALNTFIEGYLAVSEDEAVLNQTGSALLSLLFGLFDESMSSTMEVEKTTIALKSLIEGPCKEILFAPEGIFMSTLIPSQGRQLQDPRVALRLKALLPIAERMIEVFGKPVSSLHLSSMTLQLARLHDCRYLTCRGDLIRVMSAFVRVCGLSATLQVIPLNLISGAGGSSPSGDGPRAWLLPILRDNVHGTTLASWHDALYPLSEGVLEKSAVFKAAGRLQEARVWETLHFQILSILPAILSSHPTDFRDTFPRLAEVTARLLNDHLTLRPTLLAAMARFIQNTRGALESDEDNRSGLQSSELEADLMTLSSLMPQFLPLLFNIYAVTAQETPQSMKDDETAEDSDSRSSASDQTLRLIELMLGEADAGIVADYFSKTVQRIEKLASGSGGGSASLLSTVLELAGTMTSQAPLEGLLNEFLPCLISLLHRQPEIQKRTYRVLNRLLAREDVLEALSGDAVKMQALLYGLLEAVSSLQPPAKKYRYRGLCQLAPVIPTSLLAVIPQFMPEVLLGVKEVNHRTRSQAYELVVAWGRRMMKNCGPGAAGGDDEDLLKIEEETFEVSPGLPRRKVSLTEFLTMLLAGLAGSTPHMISATIMALARVLFEFASTLKGMGQGNLILSLTGDICSLLQSPSREIVKSALSFVKVSLVILDSATLEGVLELLVAGLVQWANVHHQQFKLQVRHLMERLVRRFGMEKMLTVTPSNHHALLQNIRKCREQADRKKKQQQKEGPSSDPSTLEDRHSVAGRSALSRASKKTQFLWQSEEAAEKNLLSSRARFEHALNDSDFEDQDDANRAEEFGSDSEKEGQTAARSEKTLSVAMSKKLSISGKSILKDRLPNVSRKQQEKMKREAILQQRGAVNQKRSRNDSDSEDFDAEADGDDADVRFGSDGKMIIGGGSAGKGSEASGVGDMDKIYRAAMNSFKRSADGKHVKFARGTKAANAFDEDDDSDGDNNGRSNKNGLDAKSNASGFSRKTVLTNYSKRTSAASVRSSSTNASAAHSGAQYRAKKGAAGDAKRKGTQFDPYAYVPIQRRTDKHGGGRQEKSRDRYFMGNAKRSKH